MGSYFCFNNVSVVAGWRIDWKEARLEVEKPIDKGGVVVAGVLEV